MSETMTQEAPPMEAAEEKAPEQAQDRRPEAVSPPMAVTNGLRLTTLGEMEKFAKYAIQSRLVPKEIDSITKGVIALQMGAELGMTPLLSLQSIAVINGRPTLWGDAMLGLCQRSQYFDHATFKEWLSGTAGQDDWTGHTKCRRTNGEVVERTFSVADAKKAGLWTKSGPWTQYPQRMLQYRARAFALRDTFADVLRGLHATEEMVDQILNQIDLSGGGSRTEQLVQHLKGNGTTTPPGDTPPADRDPAPEQEPEAPVSSEEPTGPSRDEYWERLKAAKLSLAAPQLCELRDKFGLKMLERNHVDKLLNSDEQLAALVITAEQMVRNGKNND